MGSALVITINTSLSNTLKSATNSKVHSKAYKKLGEIHLYFGTSVSRKLRSDHLEWFVLLQITLD